MAFFSNHFGVLDVLVITLLSLVLASLYYSPFRQAAYAFVAGFVFWLAQYALYRLYLQENGLNQYESMLLTASLLLIGYSLSSAATKQLLPMRANTKLERP